MNAPISTISRFPVSVDFKQAVNEAMLMLAREGALFVGQSVAYDGATMYETLAGVPAEQRLEMPVIEDFQLGYCIGMSLKGRLPVCIYPRMDFLLLAMNQLVNHLDRFCEMGDFRPKVIVRTRVGPKTPLNAGPQHTGNYTEALSMMLRNIDVVELNHPADVLPCYLDAVISKRSTLVVENG